MRHISLGLAALTLTLSTARPVLAQLPQTSMTIDLGSTALVVTDPQVDFLSPTGAAWGAVGKSVEQNNTVANLEALMAAARSVGMPLVVSPHYYYAHDHRWSFEGPLEKLMHEIKMFDRAGQLSLEGFRGSGADWLAPYKPYIEDTRTMVRPRSRTSA